MLVVFDFTPACGSSANSGFMLLTVRDGRIVDDSADVSTGPEFFGESQNRVLVGAGGRRYAHYAPARIFLYDRATLKLITAFDASADRPNVPPHFYGNYSADSVALGSTAVYVPVRGSTYRYSLDPESRAGRINAIAGIWLGALRGDRLYFGNGRTLLAIDVQDRMAVAHPVSGADGPYCSMRIYGQRGYVLTRDRRILTIDLDANVALAATRAPGCFFLLSVERTNKGEAALCSLSNPVQQVQVIGL